MPRLYREAPLNSIWEGSGNVIALDVLRAIAREPKALERVRAELSLANDPRVERFANSLRAEATESDARRFAERLAVAAGKYWISKRTPAHVAEALECLGGNGFVEESAMPRLYREAPLNSIWEGSGNVIALDVLRAITREPEALERVLAETRLANDPRIERFLSAIHGDVPESEARRFTERIAIALQASLLVRFSPAAISDAFCASRLDGDWGRAFCTLPQRVDFRQIFKEQNLSDAPGGAL